jgi:hypothetical protein
MAVLIEGISVVINGRDLKGEKFRDDAHFKSLVPNKTLCADTELMSVAFMSPVEAEKFIATLEKYNLIFMKNGKSKDIAVVDQLNGFSAPCEWAEFGHVELDSGEGMVASCRYKNSQVSILYTPDNWEFRSSLSDKPGFVPTEDKDEQLLYLRTDGNVDVYLNAATGKEVFIGRTKG